jgi:hypothetical protein
MQFNPSALGLWIFLAAGAIALFSMIAVASWSAECRKEREAYYRYELIKRIVEQAAAGGQTALEAFREERKWWGQPVQALTPGPLFVLRRRLPRDNQRARGKVAWPVAGRPLT